MSDPGSDGVDGGAQGDYQPRPRRGRRRALVELAIAISLAISLALAVQAYALKPYKIPSGSMEPTLDVGERVLVDRFSERIGSAPEVGQVVVFNPPLSAVPEEQAAGEAVPRCGDGQAGPERSTVCSRPVDRRAEQTFIKRVVAEPGDRIKVLGGIPVVNGEPVRGNWEIVPCGMAPGCSFPTEVTIPAEHWFVMGDNRAGSDDSRFWGPVPRAWIIGHAFASYWPPSQLGGL